MDNGPMKRLFVPTAGLGTWKTLLADPELHWKRGASAMELAVSWETAAKTPRGLPREVGQVLDSHPASAGAELLFAFPEHRVALPGGSRASQTDLWAVVKTTSGLISVAVEAKAGEPFGPTIAEWAREGSTGKTTRLQALCECLGMSPDANSALRYQLFHRSASAVLEANRIGTRAAAVLVQNFRAGGTSWGDFEQFVHQLGGSAVRNGVCACRCQAVDPLLFAWVDCPVASDADIAAATS
jgi:hypothetical protein